MRRHVIIGRCGPLDAQPLPTAKDEVVTNLELLSSKTGLAHGLGKALRDLRKHGVFPTHVGVDLAVLATLVSLADTRISRKTESQDSWTRELRLVVPVSDLQLWRGTEQLVERMLNFLTGDLWSIGYRARPNGVDVLVPRRTATETTAAYQTVSLFSGGLDSLIGAIDTLEAGATPLLVSHAADSAASHSQKRLFARLQAHYKACTIGHLRVPLRFASGIVTNVSSEDTTRGRSFLFFALGVLAGTGLPESFELRVPENGLISLNVPLDILRLGTFSTRTTHQFYIARWNELLNVLRIRGTIANPYWDYTKGEMVARCANQTLLKRLTSVSMSCASPAKGRWQKVSGPQHCGYCLPCVIRRAALRAAWGVQGDRTRYTVSLAKQALDTRKAEGEQVRSFQLAVARLRKHPGIEKVLIHKPGSLSDNPERLAGLEGVYKRGMLEVGALLAKVRTVPK